MSSSISLPLLLPVHSRFYSRFTPGFTPDSGSASVALHHSPSYSVELASFALLRRGPWVRVPGGSPLFGLFPRDPPLLFPVSRRETINPDDGRFPPSTQAADFKGKVVGVSGGDMITVLHNGKGERIRLHGIDSPEKRQAVPFTVGPWTSKK